MNNSVIKTHYSAMEIASFKLNSAPHTHKNVQEKAKRECWIARKREGRGGGLEYAFESLPQEIQAEILLKHSESKGFTESARGVAHKNYLPEVIWAPFDKASEKQRAEAQQKLTLLHKIDDLTRNNIKLIDALDMVATEFNVAKGSLKRWYYKVRTFERSDWLPLLLDKHGTNRKSAEAEFTPEVWDSFKADYFRNERPQFGSCYERLKRAAREQGWVIPSPSSVKRKIEREIPDSRLLNDIKQYVSGEKRRPLCDTVEVKAPTQRDYQITATLKLLEGFREDIVKTKARDALQLYLSDKTKKLGLDVVPSALISALRVEGVYDVTLTSPQKIVVAENEWANCTAISVEVESERTNG
ncbi:baseplate J/gp47 family protein [Pasteurella multocida]|uniref:DNA-binding domain-containing protein n=1 Tax=Pasteurella multocida TaxID=747 RepID=UPI002A59686D|nr:DNA-binding domain-containing protein [Pasteurella multocida]MDY0488310.1 baseplate J/gp47 family protein [Pasteurella multocida]MDY0594703.1 baseplate J/gp47 family protein [Pasteurella multocida]MDY0665322.1 baseplate J/gp47 family protein [Pasteurella multocida]MDY0666295.1 baseplate J/gp47 family protein [Pasteurella multocida]